MRLLTGVTLCLVAALVLAGVNQRHYAFAISLAVIGWLASCVRARTQSPRSWPAWPSSSRRSLSGCPRLWTAMATDDRASGLLAPLGIQALCERCAEACLAGQPCSVNGQGPAEALVWIR